VVGVSDSLDRRRLFEDRLADALRMAGATAWASSREMPLYEPLNADTLGPVVRRLDAEAVLVTRLVRREVNATEVEARTGVKTRRRSDYAYDFFRYDYEEYQEPAYLEVTNTAGVATDLYDAESAALIYSVETTSYDRENVYQILDDLAPAIVRRLARDDMLR